MKFFEILHFIVEFETLIAFCVFIFLIMFFTLFKFLKRISPISKEIFDAICEINKSSKNKHEFPSKYEKFRQYMASRKYTKDAWREFEETLLIPGTDFEVQDDVDEVILNTHLASTYFNKKNILEQHINMRFYNAMPNILTGIGIIGTFVGLTAGIALAAPGLNADDIAKSKEALEVLLQSASLAFCTSIAGLSTSIIFSFIEKKKIHYFSQQCQEFIGEVDARFEYFSSERIVNKGLEESKKQTVAMESFANDIAVSMAEIFESKISQPMVSAINELRESHQSASQETIEQLVEKFSDSINEAAGTEMKQFANTIQTVSDNLDGQVNALFKGQQEMQTLSQKSVEDMSNVFKQAGENIGQGVDNAVTKLNEKISESLDDISERIIAVVSKVTQELNKTTDEVASRINSMTKDVTDKLNESTQSVMENVNQSTELMFEKVNDSSQKFMQLTSKLDELNNQFKDINDENMVLIENMQSLISNVTSVVENSSKSAESIAVAEKNLTDITSNLALASDSLKETSTNMSANCKTIEDIHQEIKSLWNTHEKRFADIDSAVEKAIQGLSDGMALYAENTKDYVLGLDKQATSVVQSLATANVDLREVVEELSDVLVEQREEFESAIKDTTQEAVSFVKNES